jgi:hypothetical protein
LVLVGVGVWSGGGLSCRSEYLDLDRAASIIAERRAGWLGLGLMPHAPTWVDNDAGWPAPLLTDRSQARRPVSLGVRVSREDPYAEAMFVLYGGGWADIDYVAAGHEAVVCGAVAP